MTTNYHTPLSVSDEPWQASTMNTRFSSLDTAIGNNEAAIAPTLDATTGEGIADRDTIFIDPADGKIYIMDNNALGKSGLIRGFADGAASISTTGTLRLKGLMGGFSSLTAGLPVYADATAGSITQTRPTPSLAGTQVAVIQMGIAVSATQVFIDPKPIQYFMRDNLADTETLTIQHYPDGSDAYSSFSRKIWAYYLVSVAGASLVTYASGNQDDQVAIEDRSPATYGSDLCTGGTAIGNMTGGEGLSAAFDDDSATDASNAATSGTIGYDFGASNDKTIRQYTVQESTRATNAAETNAPKDWTFQWSDDNSAWTTVDTVTGETAWTNGEIRTFTIDTHPGTHRYWRMNITDNNGGASTRVGELEMMETATYNDGADKLTQTFNLASTQTIGSINLYLRKIGTPTGTLTCRIETVSSGDPTGTLAHASATITVAESTLSTSWGEITFTFPASFSLGSGDYAIVLDTDRAASELNYVEWGSDSSTPSYSGGEMKSYNGVSWSAETADAIFTVYGESTTHPQRVNVDYWASTHADMVNRYGDGAGANLDTKTHFKCIKSAGFGDLTVVVELP